MSLHQLGFSLSPGRVRHILSPTSSTFSTFSSSETTQDLSQDNKDVLLDRLNDLILRLSKDFSLDDTAVTAIHAEVDRIEHHIRGASVGRSVVREKKQKLEEVAERENESYWGPLSPSRSVSMRVPSTMDSEPWKPSLPARDLEKEISIAQSKQLAEAAEELASQLSETIIELQARKDESDYIHDLLITKAEKGTERILLLEYRIAEMEDDLEANQSELKFLRIQLQAIEAQCSPFIPQDEDQELSESITNWKIDWEDINRRARARRTQGGDVQTPLGDLKIIQTPILRRGYSGMSSQEVG